MIHRDLKDPSDPREESVIHHARQHDPRDPREGSVIHNDGKHDLEILKKDQ